MDLLSEDIEKYIEEFSTGEPDLLKDLNRETYLKVLMPRMLSGHVQGRFLSMISKIIQPKNILEIGTYTGYASLCLAEGLKPEGKLITIDNNPLIVDIANKYFEKSGKSDSIEFKFGNALEIIENTELKFDMIFIDADKMNYKTYYEAVLPKLNKDGIILADNVLWSGKVINDNPDKKTKAIQEFNSHVQNDQRVENVLLSVRDGLMMIRKI